MPYIAAKDGTQLYYKDWGAGRPIVMMHGWPLSADTFDGLSMAVADAGMRAIAYDRRGFGRSEQPWGGYDYDTLSDDLAAVIDALHLNEVTLLGFSMGGGEVARYMSRHGGRAVTRAVLVASVVPYMLKTSDNPHGVEQATFDGMGKALAADRASFWSGFFKDFFGVGPTFTPVSAEVLEWCRQMAMQAGLKPTLACAQAFSSTDFRPDLASFKVPTLIIHGTSDKTVPIDASARAATAGIPQSRLIEYDGAPHGLFASHEQRLIDDVLAFVKQ